MGKIINFEEMKAKLLKIPKQDMPAAREFYMLTGKSEDKCIANGNTWDESKVDIEDLNKKEQ